MTKLTRFQDLARKQGLLSAIREASSYVRWRTTMTVRRFAPERRYTFDGHVSYDEWIFEFSDVGPGSTDPSILISVVVPVFNTPKDLLELAVGSVLAQSHHRIELVLVDDGSTNRSTIDALRLIEARDDRVVVLATPDNLGIVHATNVGIDHASGEWVVFLDHDDTLASRALEWVASVASASDLVYSDEDKIDLVGRRSQPFFKPAWSPRLLLGLNYVNHMVAVRKNILARVGGLQSGFDGAQDHDLLLRIAEIPDVRVTHLPVVLYHWRTWSNSTAGVASSKPEAELAGLRAVSEAAARRGWDACATLGNGAPFNYRVRFNERPSAPTVKVVLPTRDKVGMLRRCIDGLMNRTDGIKFHIVVVDNGSKKTSTLKYLDELSGADNVTVLRIDDAFNYSRLCNAGAAVGPETPYVLFLNNDIEILHRRWLLQMIGWMEEDPSVVGVGPKLLFPDRSIQHAGVIVGFGGIAGHYSGSQPDQPRLGDLHDQTREVSALTAAVLLMRSHDFFKLDGFREELPIDFQDVDLCLRLTSETGGSLVYDPTYPLIHHESATRGTDGAVNGYTVARMKFLWGDRLASYDPFYSPHMSLWHTDMRLERMPENPNDRLARVAPRNSSRG